MNPWLCSLLQREELSRPGFRVRGPLAAQILVFAIQELVIGLCIKVLHLPGPRRVKEGLPPFFFHGNSHRNRVDAYTLRSQHPEV